MPRAKRKKRAAGSLEDSSSATSSSSTASEGDVSPPHRISPGGQSTQQTTASSSLTSSTTPSPPELNTDGDDGESDGVPPEQEVAPYYSKQKRTKVQEVTEEQLAYFIPAEQTQVTVGAVSTLQIIDYSSRTVFKGPSAAINDSRMGAGRLVSSDRRGEAQNQHHQQPRRPLPAAATGAVQIKQEQLQVSVEASNRREHQMMQQQQARHADAAAATGSKAEEDDDEDDLEEDGSRRSSASNHVIRITPFLEMTEKQLLVLSAQDIKNLKLDPATEEKVKRERRLVRNRESAAASRQKRRDFVVQLEQRAQELVSKLGQLDVEITQLMQHNDVLRSKISTEKSRRASGGDAVPDDATPTADSHREDAGPIAAIDVPFSGSKHSRISANGTEVSRNGHQPPHGNGRPQHRTSSSRNGSDAGSMHMIEVEKPSAPESSESLKPSGAHAGPRRSLLRPRYPVEAPPVLPHRHPQIAQTAASASPMDYLMMPQLLSQYSGMVSAPPPPHVHVAGGMPLMHDEPVIPHSRMHMPLYIPQDMGLISPGATEGLAASDAPSPSEIAAMFPPTRGSFYGPSSTGNVVLPNSLAAIAIPSHQSMAHAPDAVSHLEGWVGWDAQ